MGRVARYEGTRAVRMRWLIAGLLAAGLVLVACGDDDASETSAAGDSDDTTAEVSDEDATADDADEGEASDDAESGADAATGEAMVEIGDERWTFVMDLGCQQNFGALAGGGTATDDSGAQFEALVPPEDYESKPDENWSPPRVRVVLADGSSWFAASEQGQGEVTSFTNDGERVSGEGTFVHDAGEAAEGSFEFSCP